MARTDLLRRLNDFTQRHQLVVDEQLGFGVHGIVFAVKHQTQKGQFALKVHEREREYRRERDVYLRLQEHTVTDIRGCHVPELIAFDNDLWVIVMTIVTRPFVLDFAGAYLDHSPDFSDEVMAEWRADKQEQFGPRWPEVQAILRELEGYGIFMEDVNPGNVSFGDEGGGSERASPL